MKLNIKFSESNQSFNSNLNKNNAVFNAELGETQSIHGKDGKSAYEVALDNGFIGTEAEWLETLKADGSGGQFFTMVFKYSSENKRYEANESIEDALVALDEGRNVIANVDTTDYIPLLSAIRGSNPYMIFSGIYNTTSVSFTARQDSTSGVSYGNLNTIYIADRASVSSCATKTYVTTEINKKATEITKSMNILTSPNGTKFKITVDDLGVLTTTKV